MPQVTIADHEHKELLGFKERFLKMVEGGDKPFDKEADPEYVQLRIDQATIHSLQSGLPDKGIAELQAQIDKLQDALDDQKTETGKVQKAYDEAVEENGTLTTQIKELEVKISELESAAEKAA